MELPDCPPGAEGYQDVVIGEVPKKPDIGDSTKAELEFQEHLKSLKIKLEDDSTRCMVDKRGRDVSGKWIYLCYPCAAVCSGEAILQTHISGKKHKNKLAMRSVWPLTIFEEHPYIIGEKGNQGESMNEATETVLQKMAKEVDLHKMEASDLDYKYQKYRLEHYHLQKSLDNLKAPLLGLEYLVEHPPEEPHHEPAYICVLCLKQGHPRTIINHMTCFWHRYNYLIRHFPKATTLLAPFRSQNKYREGVSVIMNRLAQRIEDKFGRMTPLTIDKQEYEKDKEHIHQWIYRSRHFSETDGHTFEEVVDVGLITSLHRSDEESKAKTASFNKDPSPPVVAAPRARFNNYARPAGRQERSRRSCSVEVVSDGSDRHDPYPNPRRQQDRARGPGSFRSRGRYEPGPRPRYDPYADRRHGSPPTFRGKYALKNAPNDKDKQRPPNYEYKVKLAEERRIAAEESANKTLAYHEKNPEKHPMYPEEWKKFWNRRYKEIQSEGKDPSKHDFKPEWIEFWTARMKALHEEEMRGNVIEIYRKLCVTPPDLTRRSSPVAHKSQERGRKSPVQWSTGRRHSPPPDRRHSPPPDRRRASPPRLRRPEPRRPEPDRRRDRRSPEPRRSPPRHHSPPPRHLSPPPRHHSPPPRHHSPLPRRPRTRSRSPMHRGRSRSPARTHITLESVRRSRSPLSRRDAQLRNNSPTASGTAAPSMQTVMISDDELKPDDNLSPWNSDNDIDSLGSLPDARSPPRSTRSNSIISHGSRSTGHGLSHGPSRGHSHGPPRREYQSGPPPRGSEPQDLGPPENVVATLRLLVALEDYLGSLGPKVVDLMTTAIKMEKDVANSSEDLLELESALVLIETAKEKLKGAAQAGLVAPAAAPAVRAAVVRAAATLHAADTRARKRQQSGPKSVAACVMASGVGVTGVGSVDRAQIAQQMAAALIAQGKTDVSSEELSQLVDAVVGMAEAKKRETEVKKKVEARAMSEKQARPAAVTVTATASTASALQMLQSAYNENEKKAPEKEEVPDAMDGLSDSDLETLLKNFNELSAEEQHSLIAYLKKLEAKEPRRVEKLRQYVSAAAATATKVEEPETVEHNDPEVNNGIKPNEVIPVTIESDDDDYTVEEVFKSATLKVKENQIRQEMEIVKKSLEESKAEPRKEMLKPTPTVDLTKNMSSATDLFALVQASMQVTSNASLMSTLTSALSNVQPRSFGDLPSSNDKQNSNVDRYFDVDKQYKQPSLLSNPVAPMPIMRNDPPIRDQYREDMQDEYREDMQDDQGFRPQTNQMCEDMGDEPYNEDPSWNQNSNDDRGPMGSNSPIQGIEHEPYDEEPSSWDQNPMLNDARGPGPRMGDSGPMNNMDVDRSMNDPGSNKFARHQDDDNFINGQLQNYNGPRPGMNQGSLRDNQNFGGPQGNFGGPRGNLGGPRGSFGGPRGSFGGPRGSFGGPQGNFGGPRGSFGGPQGNFGRNEGNLRSQDDFRENLGNIRPLDDFRENLGGLRSQENFRENLGRLRPLDSFRDNLGSLRSQDNFRENLESIRPQDNFRENLGSLRPRDNFRENFGSGRPLGNYGESRGNIPSGNLEGNLRPQGTLEGSLGNLRPLGNFGENLGPIGPKSNFEDNPAILGLPESFGSTRGPAPPGNFGGNQGNRGGHKGFRGNQQGNFRGRGGRGNFGGPTRGRGRGFY